MKINESGLKLVKDFEGCRLKAYKCPAGVWTIGYGHTGKVDGKNICSGMKITEAKADELLKKDMKTFENIVNNCSVLTFKPNENQFSALTSFAFNCGKENLYTLVKGRSAAVVAEKILLYNKAGGKVLNGLIRRRKAERTLFLKECKTDKPTLKMGSRGAEVKEVQEFLTKKGMYHGTIDGIFGALTKQAVIEWQGYCEITKDGIVGKITWNTMS